MQRRLPVIDHKSSIIIIQDRDSYPLGGSHIIFFEDFEVFLRIFGDFTMSIMVLWNHVILYFIGQQSKSYKSY